METSIMKSDPKSGLQAVPQKGARSRRNKNRSLPLIPAAVRDTLNRVLDEKRSIEEIIAQLNGAGITLSEEEIVAWRKSGYKQWLADRKQLECLLKLRDFSAEVAQANPGSQLQEVGLHMVAAQVYELLSGFDIRKIRKKLSGNPDQYIRLVNAVTRLSEGGVKNEQSRAKLAEAKAKSEKELADAQKEGGLTPETIEQIERELNLY